MEFLGVDDRCPAIWGLLVHCGLREHVVAWRTLREWKGSRVG